MTSPAPMTGILNAGEIHDLYATHDYALTEKALFSFVAAIERLTLERAAQALSELRGKHATGFDYTVGIERGLEVAEREIRDLATKKDQT